MLRTLAIVLCLGLALAAPKAGKSKTAPQLKAAVAPPKAVAKDEWVEPEYCGTNDCPRFTLLEANVEEAWEKRTYEKAMWVSTTVEAVADNVDEQLNVAFNRLFDYISGENDRGEVINMTSPVATKVLPGQGPNCNSFFTQSFYVPYGNQADPAKPTNPEVFLEEFPETTIYAEMFSGYASMSDYLMKIIELSESIGEENHETAFWYRAGYDSPYNPFDRHNEAWLIAKP